MCSLHKTATKVMHVLYVHMDEVDEEAYRAYLRWMNFL